MSVVRGSMRLTTQLFPTLRIICGLGIAVGLTLSGAMPQASAQQVSSPKGSSVESKGIPEDASIGNDSTATDATREVGDRQALKPTEDIRPARRARSARMTPMVRAIRRASPSVVNIHGQKTVRTTAAGMAGATGPESFRQVNGMGTGIVIDPRGYVITNYHVVEDVKEILVTLHDGETTRADLIASRVRSDLALIKVRTNKLLPTIPRGTSSDLMIGETVIAIGNAFGYEHTSTSGIISALGRNVPVNETQDYVDLIQTSAGINPGNSGGPLLNIDGEIIGVNVAVRVGAQQIAFALPIDQVIDTITQMIDEHNARRIYTGLRTSGGPRDGDGITVTNVAASSPAAREGLKPGDRVVRVGSRSVDDRLDFALAILNEPIGSTIELEIDRKGTPFQLALKADDRRSRIATAADATAWQIIGIQGKPVAESAMRRMNSEMRTSNQSGLYITQVKPNSTAAQQGIVVGDILLGIHEWQTGRIQDVADILQRPEIQRDARPKFYIVRKNKTYEGRLQIAARPNQAPARRVSSRR